MKGLVKMAMVRTDLISQKSAKSIIVPLTAALLLAAIWFGYKLTTVEAKSNAVPLVTIKFFNGKNQEISSSRPFPLDRFGRGEAFKVTVSSTIYPVTVRAIADNGTLNKVDTISKPFEFRAVVPHDPRFDNPKVLVFYRNRQIAEQRLPIGRK